MTLSRRGFLGGTVASIGLMFGGFGWKEPDIWGEEDWNKGGKFFQERLIFYGNPQPTSWVENSLLNDVTYKYGHDSDIVKLLNAPNIQPRTPLPVAKWRVL